MGSSPIWEGSQVPGVPLRLSSRRHVVVQTTRSRGCLYVPGEAGPNQAHSFEARVPTASCAGGLHAGSHA